ncbi:molybdate ABC transporter substrate-binding protein [Cellulomonas xiejunii]|uniref:molybdate ABC transporter substrate-binding protein n=1 Tax=Cellulomonas xiejunii TaxID=2968083 RepID=UPI001D0F111E|nr:molybdate ABC transporter substrate-binding protein [Cellulomonas xiejunii]MCC2314754.1 molybdate ABC transporter substrate-binding protein [Cellulomonas xiejunii]
MTLPSARRPALVLLAVVTLGLVGCAASAPAAVPAERRPPATSGTLDGTLVVLAAASLTDVLTTLVDDLEAEHPGLTVRTSFAGSATLARQVVAGAPADVLVTASPQTMAGVTEVTGGDAVVVARNRMQLAVPAGNPGHVTSLADVADPALTVALCAPEVPCGALGAQALARAGITPSPDTLEQDVRAVLTRLTLDEADVGLVYRTDVVAAGSAVDGLELPPDAQVTTAYPALVLPDAPHAEAATAFLALLRGPEGRRTLTEAGFEVP